MYTKTVLNKNHRYKDMSISRKRNTAVTAGFLKNIFVKVVLPAAKTTPTLRPECLAASNKRTILRTPTFASFFEEMRCHNWARWLAAEGG